MSSSDEGALHRVVVIGTTGSGKTTVARAIAAITGAPHVELDALFWAPEWERTPADVFRARVAAAVSGPRWVVDGGYTSLVRDVVWAAADTIVWLDYPFPLVVWHLLRRTVVRTTRREVLWNGNRERLRAQFLSRDSLFLWARQTHWLHRRTYPSYFRQPELAHVRVVRLRRPRDAGRWLRAVAATHHREDASAAP